MEAKKLWEEKEHSQLINITNRKGQLTVSSREVAINFEKEHKDVLESVRNLIAENSAVKNMVTESTYTNDRGRTYPEYLLTRDGFSLLVMGFTGAKALAWKLKYIAAFNKMEQELKEGQPKVPGNYKEALLALVEAEEEKEKLQLVNKQQEQIIGELKPRADYTDKILKNKGVVPITPIAKDYGMSAQEMNNLLHELGVQYKQGKQWLLYSKYHNKGYTHSETIDIVRSDGRSDITMNTKWTQKGRLFIYDLLKKNNVLPIIEMK